MELANRHTHVLFGHEATAPSTVSAISPPTRAAIIIAEARASLKNPRRPFTPAAKNRCRESRLFLNDHEEKVASKHIRVAAIPLASRHGRQARPSPIPRRLAPLPPAPSDSLLYRCHDGTQFARGQEVATSADAESIPADAEQCNERLQYFPSPAVTPTPPRSPSSTHTIHALTDEAEPQWALIRHCLGSLLGCTSDELPSHIASLRASLSRGGWLRGSHNRALDRRRREQVVQAIIQWMDMTGEPSVAIAGCALILKLTRNEGVLANACKLMFKLSKSEKNDCQFRNCEGFESLIDFIRSSTSFTEKPFFGSSGALLIYVIGTLKNVSNDERNARVIGDLGAVEELGRVMDVVLKSNLPEQPDECFMQAIRLSIQATATLRNLLLLEEECERFLGVIPGEVGRTVVEVLMEALQPDAGLHDSDEVMLNVCRILSNLSLNPNCQSYMSGPTNLTAFLHLLIKYQTNKPLLVRISFILGNLTTTLSSTHIHLREGVPDLVALLGIYLSVELGEESDGDDDIKNYGRENEEVLVKLIRLVANLALDHVAGQQISQMVELEYLVELLASKPIDHYEELVLNIIGAIANISFYDTDQNYIMARRMDIAESMIPFLLHDNTEAVVEAGRVLANLSRKSDVRAMMAERRGTEILTVLLDHQDPDVVYQACGTLMNLVSPGVGARQHQAIIVENEGSSKLVDLMVAGIHAGDYSLGIVAGKALYNLRASLQDAEANKLQRLLEDLTNSITAETSRLCLEELSQFHEIVERLYSDIVLTEEVNGSVVNKDVEMEEWDTKDGRKHELSWQAIDSHRLQRT